MYLYGKIYTYILTLALCCIFIYPHIDLSFIQISLSKEIIKTNERKTLYVAFYFNVIPVDAGGQVMEFDWISNILLGKIDRPLKIIIGEEAKKMPRNDTLHVFLAHPPSINMFKELKKDGFVNQG